LGDISMLGFGKEGLDESQTLPEINKDYQGVKSLGRTI